MHYTKLIKYIVPRASGSIHVYVSLSLRRILAYEPKVTDPSTPLAGSLRSG